jgi:hypothetical protein
MNFQGVQRVQRPQNSVESRGKSAVTLVPRHMDRAQELWADVTADMEVRSAQTADDSRDLVENTSHTLEEMYSEADIAENHVEDTVATSTSSGMST